MIRVEAMRKKEKRSDGFRVYRDLFGLKSVINHASTRFSMIFCLIALHSFAVGGLLILHPPRLIHILGFNPIVNGFFPVQGGVFHVLMSFFYLAVSSRGEGFRPMVFFSIIIKLGALVFLLSYFFWVESIGIVLISGIIDGLMAVAVIMAFHSLRKQELFSPAPG